MSDTGRASSLLHDARRLALSLGPAGAGAALQMVIFALTSRALGPEAFGILAVIFATSMLFSPLAALGAEQTIVRNLSRGTADYPTAWGHVLTVTAIAFPLAWAAAVAVALWTVAAPVAPGLLAAAIAGEMLIGRAVTVTSASLVAHGMVARASALEFLVVVLRAVTALLVFVVLGSTSLSVWLTATAIQTIVTSAGAGLLLSLAFGAPRLGILRRDLGFGLSVMLNLFLQMAQTNLDKILLAQLVPTRALGVYSAGTRLQLLGNLGNLWVARLYLPGYYKSALEGRPALWRYTRTRVPLSLAVGAMSAAGMAGLAFLLPLVVGPDFPGVTGIGLVIALVPPFAALQVPAADALTALDRQNLRTAIYGGAVPVLALTITAGVALFGIKGAAGALVLTAALTAAALWAALLAQLRAPG